VDGNDLFNRDLQRAPATGLSMILGAAAAAAANNGESTALHAKVTLKTRILRMSKWLITIFTPRMMHILKVQAPIILRGRLISNQFKNKVTLNDYIRELKKFKEPSKEARMVAFTLMFEVIGTEEIKALEAQCLDVAGLELVRIRVGNRVGEGPRPPDRSRDLSSVGSMFQRVKNT